MRLVDLDPRWWTHSLEDGGIHGLTFQCPHCRTVRLGVAFANPIGAGTPKRMRPPTPGIDHENEQVGTCDHADHGSEPIWQRTGETFDALTLTPSVDASHFGHWHGFINNGAIT